MADLTDHKNLTSYKQLGFVPKKSAGNQVYGDCVFCGSKNKLFVNPETKAFDCKVCHTSGGFQGFMKSITQASQELFKGPSAVKFGKERGIPLKVIRDAGMGFNPNNNSMLLPIMDVNDDKIWDIRTYKDKKFMSLSGGNVGLYGWEKIKESNTIYICEGEWDKMAMDALLKANNKTKQCCVAAPGAGTFKTQWASMFKRKKVYVLYDHDKAGIRGANKVYQVIKSTAKDFKFLHWPEGTPDGYDLRDFFKEHSKNKTKGFKSLFGYMQPLPPEMPDGETVPTTDEEEKEPPPNLDGKYVKPMDVYKRYQKWLHLPDPEVLDVMYGTAIANRLEGDPLWLFLVAPPGGTKTELLNSISDAPMIKTTSSLTPRSLVSGANLGSGQDPSLIPKLNNKVLIVKDFTTILDMNQVIRDEIFGILRDAYDGKTEKDFGNGTSRSYKSKFGIISGVTPAIELYTEGSTSLGERFLKYSIPIPNSAKERQEYLAKAELNAGHEDTMRKELAEIGTAVLSYDFHIIPEIPDDIKSKVRALALFLSKMRGTVVRDRFTKEITHNAFSELGTRLVKQFTKLMYGIGMYKNKRKIDIKIYHTIRNMCLSSVPSRLNKICLFMYEHGGEDSEFETNEISKDLKLPKATVVRQLENLVQLGMVEKIEESALKSKWSLSEDAIYLIEEGEIYDAD